MFLFRTIISFVVIVYLNGIVGNFRRRDDIRKYWFFDCGCNRCSDRTEFGTNMSAVLCLKCKKGYLLPLDPLEYKSDWTCDHCQTITGYEMIDEIITTIEDEVSYFKCVSSISVIILVTSYLKSLQTSILYNL